ncbi:MAG: hypothetical protein EOP06_01370 [Proteobacteria bacterium]|nr:MAG: hypothetical protein EOP06_01370 [Pseudomonadota bacterium]
MGYRNAAAKTLDCSCEEILRGMKRVAVSNLLNYRDVFAEFRGDQSNSNWCALVIQERLKVILCFAMDAHSYGALTLDYVAAHES